MTASDIHFIGITFVAVECKLLASTLNPKYSTEGCKRKHFIFLRWNPTAPAYIVLPLGKAHVLVGYES